MERLIQNMIIRRIRLLDILIHTNQWVPMKELTVRLSCSQQTVLSDCDYFENVWSDYVIIERSKKRGIRILMNKNHSIGELYKKMMKNSNDLTLLESFFFYPNKDTSFHAKRLYISESSLYRSYKRLQLVLMDRNITIAHAQDTYVLCGENELQIRLFFILYFCEVYEESEWPFAIDKDFICELVNSILKILPFRVTPLSLKFLMYSMAIAIVREDQGFMFSVGHDVGRNIDTNETIFQKIKEILLSKYPKINYKNFCQAILWWDFSWIEYKEKSVINNWSKKYMEQICSSLNVEISEKNETELTNWIQFIHIRHRVYPFQEYIIHNRFAQSSISIKRNYPTYAKNVRDILISFERQTQFPWYSKYYEELLHETFFQWNELYKQLDKKYSRLVVIVFSDLGTEHEAFLAYLIKNKFSKRVEVHCATEEKYLNDIEKKGNYDLCISNYPLKNVALENLVVVEDIPSAKNWMDIYYCMNQK
ncbi:helix-turn-helix domain-containing protein [Enterococcus sp. DIV0242_7C1]|uniref:Mga helix-turn-helix domain-containing protein n=3 Tax=Candidatus Enterococcus dunnyi TaxID=1834192 RepID=A0AAQ3W2J8_9ENTE|nr:helix-turn-helix domain-containing protein [Enterococcus sp. DIV0242_7C1]MBO0470124.1 helix-turn-helix domain-containing protein [Enterococcus sp. DIV0242_7C1]